MEDATAQLEAAMKTQSRDISKARQKVARTHSRLRDFLDKGVIPEDLNRGIFAEQFSAIVKSEGLWSAMRSLNSKVPYRFTAVFAFDGDLLRNVCLVDKEDTNITHCPDQPITESYCIYIQRTGEPFSVEDSILDRRVNGHPKRNSYRCYYGIPLLSPDGNLLGTVCHFNLAPIRVTEDLT
jgi:GAF domain-containing protein